MNLTNFLNRLKKLQGLKNSELSDMSGVNEAFVGRVLRGENTMKNLDKLFQVLTAGIIVEVSKESDEIWFKITDPLDVQYYTERAIRYSQGKDIDGITTNDILLRMIEFVDNHTKTGNAVSVVYEEPYLKMKANIDSRG